MSASATPQPHARHHGEFSASRSTASFVSPGLSSIVLPTPKRDMKAELEAYKIAKAKAKSARQENVSPNWQYCSPKALLSPRGSLGCLGELPTVPPLPGGPVHHAVTPRDPALTPRVPTPSRVPTPTRERRACTAGQAPDPATVRSPLAPREPLGERRAVPLASANCRSVLAEVAGGLGGAQRRLTPCRQRPTPVPDEAAEPAKAHARQPCKLGAGQQQREPRPQPSSEPEVQPETPPRRQLKKQPEASQQPEKTQQRREPCEPVQRLEQPEPRQLLGQQPEHRVRHPEQQLQTTLDLKEEVAGRPQDLEKLVEQPPGLGDLGLLSYLPQPERQTELSLSPTKQPEQCERSPEQRCTGLERQDSADFTEEMMTPTSQAQDINSVVFFDEVVEQCMESFEAFDGAAASPPPSPATPAEEAAREAQKAMQELLQEDAQQLPHRMLTLALGRLARMGASLVYNEDGEDLAAIGIESSTNVRTEARLGSEISNGAEASSAALADCRDDADIPDDRDADSAPAAAVGPCGAVSSDSGDAAEGTATTTGAPAADAAMVAEAASPVASCRRRDFVAQSPRDGSLSPLSLDSP